MLQSTVFLKSFSFCSVGFSFQKASFSLNVWCTCVNNHLTSELEIKIVKLWWKNIWKTSCYARDSWLAWKI